MILLVLSVVLSFVSFHHSALVGDSPDLQLFRYKNELKLLSSLLAEECPEYIQQKRELTDLQKLRLETQASLVKQLEQQLLECRGSKLSPTTNSLSRATPNIVTDPAPFCPSYNGDSVFNMQFISYNNPTNKKATGVLCKPAGSPCKISLEICVSSMDSTNCNYYHHVTDVSGERSKINLINNLGELKNPVKINLGNRKWQGVHVYITVLERNQVKNLKVYREVDEFSYDLNDAQGSPHRLVTLHGKRAIDKTELLVIFTVPCPSRSTTPPPTPTILPTTPTTLPTTPTTLPPTPTILPTTPTTLPTTPTTVPSTPTTLPTSANTSTNISAPVPAECFTATNLTESWRLDHNGSNIKGGGPHSDRGYACDLHEMGWFRFSGDAGTHMLDRCPEWKSCGAYYPHWIDTKPPKAVGITASISAYQVYGNNCKFYSRRIQVMRCSLSTDHDLIYRYIGGYRVTGAGTCWEAFCGMN